jgi:hypothetical protein
MGHDLRLVVEADPVLRLAAVHVAAGVATDDDREALEALDDDARRDLLRWVDLAQRAARKDSGIGAQLTEEERSAWASLDDYERNLLTRWARDQKTAEFGARIRRDVRVHGESAPRHYATMSRDLRRTLGVERALMAPCGSRHRRAPGARPVRHHGSRRTPSGSRSPPGDDDPDPESDRAVPAFRGRPG